MGEDIVIYELEDYQSRPKPHEIENVNEATSNENNNQNHDIEIHLRNNSDNINKRNIDLGSVFGRG